MPIDDRWENSGGIEKGDRILISKVNNVLNKPTEEYVKVETLKSEKKKAKKGRKLVLVIKIKI